MTAANVILKNKHKNHCADLASRSEERAKALPHTPSARVSLRQGSCGGRGPPAAGLTALPRGTPRACVPLRAWSPSQRAPGPLSSGLRVIHGQRDQKGHFTILMAIFQQLPLRLWVPGSQVRKSPGAKAAVARSLRSLHSRPAARAKGKLPGAAPFPPQPGSPTVPGEGAEEPDAGSQGGPHLAGWCPPKEGSDADGGGRRAVSPSRRPRDLNAPPAGPPRPHGPVPGAPAPLHLTALGSDPEQTDCPSSHGPASTWFSPAWTRPGDPQCTELLGPLPLPCAPRSLPAGNRKLIPHSAALHDAHLSQLFMRCLPVPSSGPDTDGKQCSWSARADARGSPHYAAKY